MSCHVGQRAGSGAARSPKMQWEFSVRSCGSVCNKPPLHKRGDVEIINYLQDAAGARNLVFDLAVTYLRLLAQGGSDTGGVRPNHLATL